MVSPQHMHAWQWRGLLCCPRQSKGGPRVSGSQVSLHPHTCQPGLPGRARPRLWPLTSALRHNAQPVPETPAQRLLGAEFGAGSEQKAEASQHSRAPACLLAPELGAQLLSHGVKYSAAAAGGSGLLCSARARPLFIHSLCHSVSTQPAPLHPIKATGLRPRLSPTKLPG